MRFQYTEKKVTLPENVHKYAEKKVMKLERFFGTDADALVTFSVEKNRNNVEITVHAANTYFRASESTSDMFASIDAAVATIERQIRKNKTRLARRLRQDAFVRTPDETSFAPEEPEEPTSALDPELTGEVLKVIRSLSEQHMTMIIVTHEMAFARDVAGRVIFMDGGVIVEQGPARDVIENPQAERTRQFLARYRENQ